MCSLRQQGGRGCLIRCIATAEAHVVLPSWSAYSGLPSGIVQRCPHARSTAAAARWCLAVHSHAAVILVCNRTVPSTTAVTTLAAASWAHWAGLSAPAGRRACRRRSTGECPRAAWGGTAIGWNCCHHFGAEWSLVLLARLSPFHRTAAACKW